MKLKKIFVFGVFVISIVSILACNNKDQTEVAPIRNSKENIKPWSNDSLSMVAFVVGTGPEYRQDPVGGSKPGQPVCQLNSKIFHYERNTQTLSLKVCEEIHSPFVNYTKKLTAEELGKIDSILSQIASFQKTYSEEPCPADFAPYGSFVEIEQNTGIHFILEDKEERPCGTSDGKYTHGTLPNLQFLNEVEKMIRS